MIRPGDAAITTDEMLSAEYNSEYLGVTHFQLMEAVGARVAQEVAVRLQGKPNPRIHIIAGPGKNGGDGFAVARHLASQGYKVKVTLVAHTSDVHDPSSKQELDAVLQMSDSIQFESLPDSSQLRPVEADIILDAILGYGIKGELRQPLLGAVRIINRSKGYKIAVDLPSGIDSDTGEPHGEAVKADLTISLHKIKQGLAKATQYTGETVSLPIGIPPEAETYAGPGDVKILWKPRPATSHKGDYGRLLIIGGSENFTGAPAFSALAATKCGTDLVYVASPAKTSEIIASYSPDLITVKLPGDHINTRALSELSKWTTTADAIVLGPGIGLHEETVDAVKKLISEAGDQNKPMVLDADALKIFGRNRRRLRNPAVLTPHQGEFAQVLQRKISPETQLRQEAVKQLAAETGATVVLKGNLDIIADPTRLKLNKTGNPYMTVGGTGDVLTGIIGAFLAQKVEPFKAATAGAFLNGLAGDMLMREKGPTVTPLALVDHIPRAIKYCVDGPPFPPIRT
ncbi:MAG TPA: NAD(P)H-hydrate dehydratase [Candidatus Dormibacteraeota bacterium]|nr:NAD(P)H-hydrate dehydratase [Candidatus Dormibacteraeota bacterium]